ncbi:uncharacterized protein LOC127811998 [Diospyros lotus]|uniref:uncharacterized protein LOC127811998 n=1 Tax=Diospyros lotus TaxID=55363 RepID=UPI0022577EBD|nr:uncharacterized protein LOC127811998 [Diospyros lotus]
MSSTTSKTDPAWNYFEADPNDRNTTTYKFCRKVTKCGIFRAKQHLVGGFRNTKSCPKCPLSVKEEIEEYMQKKKNNRDERNIASLDDDLQFGEVYDDDDDEPLPQSRKRPNVSTGSGSGTGSVGSVKGPTQKGPLDVFLKDPEVNVLKSKGKGKQTRLGEHDFVKKELRARVCRSFARWMYDAGIPFNAVTYDSFKVFIEAVGQYGPSVKPPSYHEVRVPLLKQEVEATREMMKDHEEAWAKYGCSILSDGWKDKRERTLINFLVNSLKGSMFLESVDGSSYSKTGEKMFQLLSKCVEKIGVRNVVQVVTDSVSNNVLAGRFLEAKYPTLFWTPCAAHCLDLMLENIFKLPNMKKTFERAVMVNSYIYTRSGLVNMLRRFTDKKELLRPAKTRFATAFITLGRMHSLKSNLRKMFTSEEWMTSKWVKEAGAKKVVEVILMPSFWNNVVFAIKVASPLVCVLRLVNGEKKPAMGYIYEAMDRAKEAIANSFNGDEKKYAPIFQIIDNRWDVQLHRPLHAAGWYLNPEYFYKAERIDPEIMTGLYECIRKLNPDIKVQDQIDAELSMYSNADGFFGNYMAIRKRAEKSPGTHIYYILHYIYNHSR